MIVAIDGPASSGKSTTARRVAGRLGFRYLDTGAMYRAAALAFLRAGRAANAEAAADVLPELTIDLQRVRAEGEMRVHLEGEDVTERIRTPAVTEAVTEVSALPAVREKLAEEQRRFARTVEEEDRGVVVDGRDMGTVVFPEADVKVFLVATLDERARRRQAEMNEQGEDVSFEAIRRALRARDQADSERAVAPLRRAEDAVEVDTTHLTIEDQVNRVTALVRERQVGKAG